MSPVGSYPGPRRDPGPRLGRPVEALVKPTGRTTRPLPWRFLCLVAGASAMGSAVATTVLHVAGLG